MKVGEVGKWGSEAPLYLGKWFTWYPACYPFFGLTKSRVDMYTPPPALSARSLAQPGVDRTVVESCH